MKKTGIFLVLVVFYVLFAYGTLLKSDFRVNDDSTNGNFYFAEAEIFGNGNFCILWSDQRNGISNIYAQMYDSTGTPLGQNFKVSTMDATVSEFTHSSSVYHDTLIDIQRGVTMQLLDSSGNRIDTTFYFQNQFPSHYNFAIHDGNIFAVWDKFVSGSSYDIFFQSFDFQGDSISPTVKINDDASNTSQILPQIAVSETGNIIIVWQDYRNGNYDIYGQILDSSLNAVGSNFLVPDSPNATQSNPVCAMDSAGNFSIFWQDARNGAYNIFGQRYSSDGSPLGTNFKVSDSSIYSGQDQPKCAIDKHGNLFVSWSDTRNGPKDIYCQKYDSLGNAIGSNFEINEPPSFSGSFMNMDIAYTGNAMISVWEDTGDSTYIYFRLFDKSGTPKTAVTMINDIKGTNNQLRPRITMSHENRAITIWQDDRIYNGIYFQVLDSLGDKIGSNKYLDTGFYPDITGNDSLAIATYISADRKKIYCRLMNFDGDTLLPLLNASDDSSHYKYYPAVSVNNSNDFAVVWDDSRDGNENIYFTLFDSTLTTIVKDIKANDDAGTSYQSYPSVAVNDSGYILIVWTDNRDGGNYNIYGQLYDNNANKIGNNFIINDDNTAAGQYFPYTAALSNGNFIVAWQDYRIQSNIFAQLINPTGALIDSNIRISENYAWAPDIAPTTDGKFIITWFGYPSDTVTEYDILAREYNDNLTPLSPTIKINNPPEGLNKNQRYPAVATDGKVVMFAWEDTKWERGYDIAANVYSLDLTGLKENFVSGKIKINISGTITKGNLDIKYALPKGTLVDLSIYNIIGRKIRTIENGFRSKGSYHIRLNCNGKNGFNIRKGIYFIMLKTNNKHYIRKFILL